MKVSMTIRGVEIIPPSESRDAWDLVFLIRAALASVGMRSPTDMEYIAQVQRWLNLPPGDYLAGLLIQFILGTDCEDGVGVFADDSLDALPVLGKRAKQILSKNNPAAFIREQVLYAAGMKEGPRPSDLAMLKGGEREVSGLDAIVRRENGESVGTVAELASMALSINIDLGLTQVEMEELVSRLRSKDKRLTDAIAVALKSRKLAANGADANYQRIHRALPKLKAMAQRLKASRQGAVLLTGGSASLTIIGEHVLSTTSKKPVQHSGTTSHEGLVFKPANMELDESKPTKLQAPKKKRPHK